MKKLIYVFSAIALLGLASACVDQIETNPDFDPVKNTVTTQFVLNIAPAAADAQTKQSDAAVQMNKVFRGLNNASLLTFSVRDGENLKDGSKIISLDNQTMHDATSYIDLSYALKPNSIDPWQDPTSYSANPPYSRRIVQIDLPTETNTLVFYGEAVTGASGDLKNDFGKLGYRTDGLEELDMRKIGCWAWPRLPDNSAEATDYHRIEDLIEAVYNNLFKIEHTFSESTFGSYNMDGVTLKWADYLMAYDFEHKKTNISPIPRLINAHNGLSQDAEGALPDVQASPFEVILAKAYHSFKTMRTGELRGGSGKSILRQVSDLYTVLYDGSQSDATSALEEIANVYFEDITTYIGWFFEKASATSRQLSKWKAIGGESGVKRALESHRIDTLPAPVNTRLTLTDFPLNFDMPLGAATMTLKNGDFEYQSHNIPLPAMGDGTMTVHDYTYPPSLVYFGNAPVRISNSNNLTDNDFQDGTNNWENGTWSTDTWLSGSGTVNGFSHVTSNTRGVAMAFNIQYANALLETTVQYADSVVNTGGTGLADNNKTLNGDPDNVFHPSASAGLQLTGILVGGQPDTVGWNYLATSGAHFNKMVYDKRMNSVTGYIDTTTGTSTYALDIPYNGDKSPKNYTTLFDNYDKNNSMKDVYIALEFRNNLGTDFWGNANMVRNEGAFYLIGKLTITDAVKNTFSWDRVSKIMPPYDASGNTLTGDAYLRIFMQDFVTKVNFTIGKNALKSAYVTVPDLRSSSLSLGLSVDLEWREGLTFDNVPLGM